MSGCPMPSDALLGSRNPVRECMVAEYPKIVTGENIITGEVRERE
jgi:hypothetical protein